MHPEHRIRSRRSAETHLERPAQSGVPIPRASETDGEACGVPTGAAALLAGAWPWVRERRASR